MSECPKCYSESFPIARKEHRCCECGGRISIGEKYHYFKGVWDEPGQYKTCIDCKALRDSTFSISDEWCFGDLAEGWTGSGNDFEEKFEDIMIKRGVQISDSKRILPEIKNVT